MQQITFQHANIEVQDGPGPGERTLVIAEILPVPMPPGMPPIITAVYSLPMPGEVAEQIGKALISPRLEIAQTIDLPQNGNRSQR